MMIEHGELLGDKMAEVARGTAAWSAEEAAHLASCAECAAEWSLVERAARLGGTAAAALDATRIAAAVRNEVARRARRERWTRAGWLAGLAAAAAVALVVFTGRGGREPQLASGTDSGLTRVVQVGDQLPLAELESLDPDQLESVLDGLDAPVGQIEGGPAPSFGDLDDTQLERVLRSLEG